MYIKVILNKIFMYYLCYRNF